MVQIFCLVINDGFLDLQFDQQKKKQLYGQIYKNKFSKV